MAELIPSIYNKWKLTEEEQLQGSILTITQTQVIHNRITELAEEKLLLEVDSSNLQRYLQQEAKLSGQISELAYLLEQSEALRLDQANYDAD